MDIAVAMQRNHRQATDNIENVVVENAGGSHLYFQFSVFSYSNGDAPSHSCCEQESEQVYPDSENVRGKVAGYIKICDCLDDNVIWRA